jgi:peptide/nickel transport system substrate-binding protein
VQIEIGGAPQPGNSIMRIFVRYSGLWLCVLLLAAVSGCGSKETPQAADVAEVEEENAEVEEGEGTDDSTEPAAEATAASTTATTAAADAAAAAESKEPAKPFVLGDMLEPFDPPSLEEIDKTAEWEDRPVLDGLKLMREHQAKLGPPPLTVEQALAMKNESREDNEKIANTLGRLAPEDGKGVDYESELVLLAEGDLKSTNPLLTQTVTEFDYQGLTVFGIFTFDWELEKFADSAYAESWQSSKDRMMDKVVIRKDLTWSDGKPITAHDVEFSFKVLLSEAVIIPAMRQGTDQLKYVKAYDDHTLVFFHKQPLATNDGNMNFYVIPKHIYETNLADDPTMTRSKANSSLEDAPVVGGPYTLKRRIRGQEFVLERRESYYMHDGKQVRDKPYFKTIRFKVIEDRNTALLAVKAGSIESLVLIPDQWQNQTGDESFYQRNTKVSGEEWTDFHFVWNIGTPYFSDKRVRQAMSYAFDYDEMLNTIYYGLYDQSRGNFHPTSKMFPKNGPQPFKQDLDKAEELLDEAGWTDSDGDGIRDKMIDGRRVPFEFNLLCAQFEDRIQTCTLMKECLDSIGIVCNVKPTEFTVLTQMLSDHKFHAELGGWGTGADPDTNTNIWYTGEQRNYGQYSNPKVDELFVRARKEFDPEKRYALYGEIHNLLWEDQPYTWLYNRSAFYAFNKKLRGYNFSPRGPFHYAPGVSSIHAAAMP